MHGINSLVGRMTGPGASRSITPHISDDNEDYDDESNNEDSETNNEDSKEDEK
jgi:hypothetical protein